MGRQTELDELAQKLQSAEQVAITAVSGMGGIGKTALVQQYVRQAKEKYPGGRWYFKVREQSLAAQLVNAAVVFGWQLPQGMTDSKAQAQWCYGQWQRNFPGDRLLLLDDVQQYSDVKEFLPKGDFSFPVLMTSRRRFGKPVNRLDLGVLPLNEAMELLTSLIGDDERVQTQKADAEKLCEWVGRLPLGIELIGRYLEQDPVSFGEFQDDLEETRLQTIALQDLPEEMAYEYSIQAAFELSWQTLDSEAKTLMGLVAIFAQAPIPLELIAGAVPEWSKQALRNCLNRVLVQRNLLQRDVDESYQLHQLIREFTAIKLETELSVETSVLKKGVANSLTNFAKQIEPIVTVSVRQVMTEVMPHMGLVAQELSHLIVDSTDALWPFISLGRFYQSQSLWPETENWYQSCLKMTEKRFGSDHPDTATSLNNLAGLYRSMGRYGEAEPLYARSLEISEAQLGPDHPDTAGSYNNMAMFYYVLEQYAESANFAVRALDIFLAKLGQDHPNTQTVLNNFVAILRKVVETNQTDQLSDHPLTQAILESLQSE